jgi:hypothetical protein
MLNKTALFFIYISVFTSILLSAQQNISISGKVINSKTKEPIPFVALLFKNTFLTQTDVNGNFEVKLENKYANDTIKITYVGFEKRYIPIVKYKNLTNVAIDLKPIDYNIDNVVIKGENKSAQSVIKKINTNIYKNYYHNPFNYNIIITNEQFIDKKSTKKSDIELTLYDKTGYNRSNIVETFRNISYKVKKINRNYITKTNGEGYFNIDDILKADIIRNSNNILDISDLSDYKFVIKHEKLNKDSVWVIEYSSKNPTIYNCGSSYVTALSGEIIVNKSDFAVLKNNTKLTLSNLNDLGLSFFDKVKNDKTNITIKYSAEYQKNENFYSINNITYELIYTIDNKEFIEKSFLRVESIKINSPEIIIGRQYFVK